MSHIRVRPETGLLYFDFQYLKVRCREQSNLRDTPENRKLMERVMAGIAAEIKKGSFRYRSAFPSSRNLEKIEVLEAQQFQAAPPLVSIPMANQPARQAVENISSAGHPTFAEFAEKFIVENESLWKRSNIRTKRDILEKWLIPQFGKRVISSITKQDLLEFRSVLAKAPGKKPGTTMSASRINHVMTSIKQVLDEAADRFNFTTPYQNIKRMRIKKTDVTPFTIEEVEMIIKYCREDFRDYFTVKFFTGMRPGEIHGLKWKYVDFEKRLITIRETIVDDYEETPKTADSNRDIQMAPQVYEALKTQWEVTGKKSAYVFANGNGGALTNRNMSNRVWYPMLRSLGLKLRTPYQTRHTFATLMLAAGESPEWIAFQMGHSSTEMLFKVYSRYVPNLTRRDGSAFERMLAANLGPSTAPAADEAVMQPLIDTPSKTSLNHSVKSSIGHPLAVARETPASVEARRDPVSKAPAPVATPVIDPDQASKPAIQNPWLQMFESYQSNNTQGE